MAAFGIANFVLKKGVYLLFHVAFDFRYFVFSLDEYFSLFLFFARRFIVISSFLFALFRGEITKKLNGLNRPPLCIRLQPCLESEVDMTTFDSLLKEKEGVYC